MDEFGALMLLMGKGAIESTKLMARGAGGLLRRATKNTPEHRNQRRRGVTEYKPSELGGFFPSTEIVDQMIVSGGSDKLRAETIEAYTELALYQNIPVIVLHNGDYTMEQYMSTMLAHTGLLGIINGMNPNYEPFLGKNSRQISQMIVESAPKDMDIKSNVRTYIEGMCAFLQSKKIHPTYKMLSTCPHGQMLLRVDEAVMQGKMKPDVGQQIKMRLMAGQQEYYKVENYFYDLEMQIQPIVWHYDKNNPVKPYNILNTLKNNGVLLIDVGASANQILMNLLLAELKLASQQGTQVCCVLDGVDISNNEYMQRMLEQSGGKYKIAMVSRDVYASCNADDKIFNLMIGKSMKNILYSHSSNVSATKWAEAIGMYDKEETSYSYSQGKSHNPMQLFSSTNSSQSMSISMRREYIVKPEELLRMQEREAYIYTKAQNELAHTMLV